jgi:hypothetical protein
MDNAQCFNNTHAWGHQHTPPSVKCSQALSVGGGNVRISRPSTVQLYAKVLDLVHHLERSSAPVNSAPTIHKKHYTWTCCSMCLLYSTTQCICNVPCPISQFRWIHRLQSINAPRHDPKRKEHQYFIKSTAYRPVISVFVLQHNPASSEWHGMCCQCKSICGSHFRPPARIPTFHRYHSQSYYFIWFCAALRAGTL